MAIIFRLTVWMEISNNKVNNLPQPPAEWDRLANWLKL